MIIRELDPLITQENPVKDVLKKAVESARRPLFSTRMVADLFPQLLEFSDIKGEIITSDIDGYPVRTNLKLNIDHDSAEAEAIMHQTGGGIRKFHVVERPDRAIYETSESGCSRNGRLDFSEGIMLIFKGKHFENAGGIGIMKKITDPQEAPKRKRADILNIPRQGTLEFEKWTRISRAFMLLEKTLTKASSHEMAIQPRLL